jgi:hypothetical protein
MVLLLLALGCPSGIGTFVPEGTFLGGVLDSTIF